MKEIIAIIRRAMVPETKAALDGLGYTSMYFSSVSGRGRQKGIMGEIDPSLDDLFTDDAGSFIPKRMLTMMVADKDVEGVVRAVMEVNRSGNPGDGRVFVCPVADAVRVRTSERGEQALG